ncbi:hypothetical protein HMPREF2087_01024 [Helicobacter canis NCTC 12740]|uniref:Sulphate adenylyltransferase catalytic domain-containing protein n=2 Tax=Helicobacter canis TaxID=29419 RepID=V8CH07_9HELI|nr:hypothetical protein HMPREF2087_01024 [Helicobacter canis NCTC 12740]
MQRYQRHSMDSSEMDSVLGRHSGDFKDFMRTADHQSSSPIKSLKSTASPTATPRILEEKQTKSKTQTELESSLRDTAPAVARQSTQTATQVDSRKDYSASAEYVDCRALPSDKARNDDENAQKSPQVDSRICENAQSSNTPQAEANLDSSKSHSNSKILDEKCGLQSKARNDNENAQNVFSQNAARRQDLGDKNGALQGESRAHTLAYVTADSPQQSPFLAPKPTPKPNQALHIDKEALSSLALVQEGLLAPISSLANSKTLHLDSYLTPFVLNPAGKRNRKVLESTKPNDVLDIVFERRKVGYLRVEEVFPIDRHARTIQLTGLQGGAEFDRIYSRLGDLAVCGEYQVHFPDIKEAKASLQEQITAHNAKHITGLVLDGQIFHKAHEALIRDALSMSDLVVLFLLKPYRHTIIHYDMQKECVELAMREYLMSDRICTIPLDDTYLFTGTNNVLLHAMVARNYGCTHFIVSDNTPNLSVFYERNTLYSVLDVVSGISTSIKGGYVYCDVCQMLVNRTTCPHGKHHHISYDTESILEFFKAGLLPPSVLVRPSISAKLIAHLFPNRFSNLQKLYYDLMPLNDGVLVPKSEEDFYLKLMQLYAIHSK